MLTCNTGSRRTGVGGRLNVSKDIRQGFNTTLRTVWRPVNEENRLVHAVLLAYYRIPDKKMDAAGSIIELSPSIFSDH